MCVPHTALQSWTRIGFFPERPRAETCGSAWLLDDSTYASLPQGVEFEKHDVEITDDFRTMYDKAVDLWADIDVAFQGAKEDGALIGKEAKAARTQQWGARPARARISRMLSASKYMLQGICVHGADLGACVLCAYVIDVKHWA